MRILERRTFSERCIIVDTALRPVMGPAMVSPLPPSTHGFSFVDIHHTHSYTQKNEVN
jgi:hypothetical protein